MKNKLNDNINLEGAPNEKYEKFFKKFEEISILNPSSWNVTHLLGYFCKKYKEQYQTEYKFKFNSPTPSKCFEVFQIKKLAMNLTSDPTLLKEYIDWVYDNKVVKAKRKLTSISFMTNEGIVNEYKINVLLSNDDKPGIDRTTPLPNKYKIVFETIGFPINTYGELAFIYQMDDEKVKNAFSQIELIGFDKSKLEKIV
jgi:retron-type reverse transcriptase